LVFRCDYNERIAFVVNIHIRTARVGRGSNFLDPTQPEQQVK